MFSTRAFTLMEILIVVILVGIIAAFIMPDSRQSVENEFERSARYNLEAIYNTQRLLRAKTGDFWPVEPGVQDLAAINNVLGINIQPDGMTYTCDLIAGGNKCLAQRSDGPAAYTLALCVNNGTICCDTLATIPCPSVNTACPY